MLRLRPAEMQRMSVPIERRVLRVTAADGAHARVQVHLPPQPEATLYWLPALGVGLGPNETLADALAARGVAVALHEWRGLGESDRRASSRCDWGYRELLDQDIAAGMDALDKTLGRLPCFLGGHSLGGQFALIEAARRDGIEGVLLVASGQPYWAAFPGWRAWGVRLFAHAITPITALAGHFPGGRLGFAGREASLLMREWAGTALRGDYRIAGFDDELDQALVDFRGRVLAIRMEHDRLAPAGALQKLRALAPQAQWEVQEFGRERFRTRKPDHFGWMREPESIAAAFDTWRRTPQTGGEHATSG
jgi:predicted alpha/beta hydrolase